MISSAMKVWRQSTLTGVSLLALFLSAQPANAQTATGLQADRTDTTDPSSAPADADIVVTGSRITRRDFDSASPIVTVGRDLFERSGAVNVDSLVQSLPQLGSSIQGSSGNNNANGGTSQVNLHYLGANRTLLLLDGRRTISGAPDGAGDLNSIPLALVQSVEIITGGASAVYGSDAIAGVVNFKLNERFKGLRISGLGGVSDRGDAFNSELEATYGLQDREGRGGIIAYGSYSKQGSATTFDRPRQNRDLTFGFDPAGTLVISDTVSNFLSDGAYIPVANNLPSQASVDTVFGRYGATPGTVLRTNTLGFNNDGTLFSNAPLVNYRNGTASNPYYFANNPFTTIQVPNERYTAGLIGRWQFSENFEPYARVYYMHSDVQRQISPYQLAATVPITNPFIPAALRTILATRPSPNAGVSVQRTLNELGVRTLRYEAEQYQVIGGIRGKIAGDWRYDIYGSYGRNRRDEQAGGALRVAPLTQLVTAADGGASLCTGGLNLFGLNTISQSCIDFISYTPRTQTTSTQTVLEGTVNGSLFALPAGDVKVALGATYRREKYDVVGDPLFQSGAVVGGLRPASSVSGAFNVKEVYGEVLVPVFSDKPFAYKLELSAGYRYSDYSSSGSSSAYKGEAIYAPIREISFRGSYQRAVRSPSINELFLPQSLSNITFTQDPCSFNSSFRTGAIAGVTPASVRSLCLSQGIPAATIDTYVGQSGLANALTNRGNPALTPEIADTYTGGLVLRSPVKSGIFSNVSASIDYYRIKIANTISLPVYNDILIRCYNQFGTNPSFDPGNTFCNGLVRSPTTGAITSAVRQYLNVGAVRLSGIDGQIDWRVPLGDGGRDGAGEISLQFAGSYLIGAEQQPLAGAAFTDLRGTYQNGAVFPRWKHSAWIQYAVGAFDIGGRWRHIASLQNASILTAPTVKALEAPAYDTFDVDLGFRVNQRFALRFGVNNVTDRQAPYFQGGTGNNTDSQTYDLVGRRYYARFTADF